MTLFREYVKSIISEIRDDQKIALFVKRNGSTIKLVFYDSAYLLDNIHEIKDIPFIGKALIRNKEIIELKSGDGYKDFVSRTSESFIQNNASVNSFIERHQNVVSKLQDNNKKMLLGMLLYSF